MTARLLDRGTLMLSDLDAIAARVAAQIARATEFATASPFPDASELTTDVYA